MMRQERRLKAAVLQVSPVLLDREATVRHVALEGRCFVFSCNQYVEKCMYPDDLEYIGELESLPEVMCPGGTLQQTGCLSPRGRSAQAGGLNPSWIEAELSGEKV